MHGPPPAGGLRESVQRSRQHADAHTTGPAANHLWYSSSSYAQLVILHLVTRLEFDELQASSETVLSVPGDKA